MKKNKTKKTTRKTILRLCLLHETATMESVWPGLPTYYFLRDSLWKFLADVFLGWAVCRNFWAMLFFGCFFCFFSVFLFFFRFISRKKQKKKVTKKKGVTPGPRSPGRQPPNPPSLCIGEIWCLLKPYFAIYKSTQSSAAPCFVHLFFLVFSICFFFILLFHLFLL